MAILVGATAPDFTLPGWYLDGESTYTLSAERGHPVVLVFYPNDQGLVCTRQLCSYSDNLSDLRLSGAVVWGVAPQSLQSHRELSEGRQLKMPLLSDADKAVAGAYGILGPMGLRRSVFVIDAAGAIAWRRVTALSLTFPTVAEVRTALDDVARAA
jgi:thioredoxin-dependent peroxiredoxin